MLAAGSPSLYHGEYAEGISVLDVERGVVCEIHSHPWQTDTCIGGWFSDRRTVYKTTADIVHMLGEGPTQTVDGEFKETSRQWTAKDFRFTCKGNTVYSFQMNWPDNRQALITSLGLTDSLRVKEVNLIGYDGIVSWSQMAEGLHIDLPSEPPCEAIHVFSIRL